MPCIANLQCEFQADPVNIGTDSPLLSWNLCPGSRQTAYLVQVFRAKADRRTGLIWESGWKDTTEQRLIYTGPAPRAGEEIQWQLRIRDASGHISEWQRARWRRGLKPEEWQAEWIGLDAGRERYDPSIPYYCADDFQKGVNHPFLPKPVLMRKTFTLREKPVSALIYVTALGLADVCLNGKPATDNPLLPGVCDFRKRSYSFAWDVSHLLRNGSNTIAAVLADGWYAGYIGLNPREWWGSKPRLRAELHLFWPDGTVEKIMTGPDWRGCTGPWLYADILHGCGYDARLEPEGWKEAAFQEDNWQSVQTGAERETPVYPHPGVSVKEGMPIRPVRMQRKNADEILIDFGKCFSGVIRITVQGKRGTRIDLYHAEETERDGSALYLFGNRSAECHDCYILSGNGVETFTPRFTYHGFRYALAAGLQDARLIAVEGIPLNSLIPQETMLQAEHRVVQQDIEMIRCTAQCNLVDIVTDVCARDERLGWGCEGNLFMHTACMFGNMALFLRKWLQDALDGQQEDGCFWAIAPAVMMRDIRPFAGDLQSDIALHCTWLLMKHYDDRRTVENAWPQLQAYTRWQERNADRCLRFATARDWLDLTHNGHSDRDHGYGGCDPALIGTAWFAMDARMMAEIADYLNLKAEQAEYQALYERIRAAFRTFFAGRNHLLRGCTQGGYLLAAEAGLLELDEVEPVRTWIREDMREKGGITWGTATAPVALQGLCRLGMAREAAAFLRRESYPSLGYMHRCGATTVWERWDAVTDNRFNPHPMNAFSHIGLASVGEWIVSGLAGIRPASPGYREIIIEPVFDRETGGISATYISPLGPVRAAWRFAGNRLTVEAELPPGTRGTLILPAGMSPDIRENTLSAVASEPDPSGKVHFSLKCGKTVMLLNAGKC